MAIANSKRTTDTNSKTKHGAEPITKPLATKIATVVRRPAPVQAAAETTTTSETTAAKPKKPTYEARMRALPPVVCLQRKLANTTKRISKITSEVQRWANAPADLRDAATTVATALAAMLAGATALPDDFKPERTRKAGQLTVGMKAALHAKVAAKSDGILEADERESLEIVSVARGLVSVKTVRGARLVLPRAHVAKSATEKQATSTDRAASVHSASFAS